MNGSERHVFSKVLASGHAHDEDRALAAEVPVAVSLNGFGYAVLMASPLDVEDLVYGFLLSERIIDAATDVLDGAVHETADGIMVRTNVAPHAFERVAQRVRHRTTDSSCGLCGIENLEQAIRPFPHRVPAWSGTDGAVFAALGQLGEWQQLNRTTAAVHGAAHCAIDGTILALREDVGRHNAFDKLIGAMARSGRAWEGGFALLTSRCSYELVEKAVLSHCPMLATISAPTDLAARRAREAGLTLRVLARPDALLASLP